MWAHLGICAYQTRSHICILPFPVWNIQSAFADSQLVWQGHLQMTQHAMQHARHLYWSPLFRALQITQGKVSAVLVVHVVCIVWPHALSGLIQLLDSV